MKISVAGIIGSLIVLGLLSLLVFSVYMVIATEHGVLAYESIPISYMHEPDWVMGDRAWSFTYNIGGVSSSACGPDSAEVVNLVLEDIRVRTQEEVND